jgi:hypothetical protein
VRDLFGSAEVRHVHPHHRKKGVDVDKPEGFIKRNMRRRLRAVLKSQLARVER